MYFNFWEVRFTLQRVLCLAHRSFRWTYADPSWARIAALAPVVITSAEADDEIANKILVEAVEELATCVKSVVQRLHLCGQGINY